ncbi:MAG: ATP-binding cassette domain-containing protein [Coriobacteriales bacterium]|jgi:energy-coupling factor transport system ATP-binding protein|nr:ATP-binding cassette domain-containing protein [Coriobacteriales bacterium]
MLGFNGISFTYAGSNRAALHDVSLALAPGERVVVLGANGSGKSTLARLANGLLLPESGSVSVDEMLTVVREGLRELRTRVGVVAQDPDNQIVATTVLDDVAFGAENLGLPHDEIVRRCSAALAAVGLEESVFADRDPNTLSGGEKQRLVLAGILAMEPSYLVLDEPTSMLDPEGRTEVEAVINELYASGHGILHITHDLAYARTADRVAVLSEGALVYNGPPAALLNDEEALEKWGLAVAEGLAVVEGLAVAEGLPDGGSAVCLAPSSPATLIPGSPATGSPAVLIPSSPAPTPAEPVQTGVRLGSSTLTDSPLLLDHISYTYAAGTNYAHEALRDVTLAIEPGTATLLGGHTGSGKSTLLRVAAGLLAPGSGSVQCGGTTVLPGRVGLVFQQPESQLFAATVAEDILFGPRNLHHDTDGLVAFALSAVGLSSEHFADRSPFLLSGGEMRRVAIATVLAMNPRFLLLDEPTAGLDARGRAFVHALIARLCAEGVGVLVVSHDVEEFALRVHRQVILRGGELWPS